MNLKSNSHLPKKIRFIRFNENPLKMTKNAFYFKISSFSFGHIEKTDKVNFKIYDVIIWLINNCNTRITQYISKLRQPGNEIWSVNII